MAKPGWSVEMLHLHALNRWPARPTLRVETLLLLGAVFLMVAGNGPFWHAALAGRGWSHPATWRFAACLFVLLASGYLAFAGLLATRHTVRPLLALLFLVTAGASFFMDRYAIYLDRAMLRNLIATNPREAGELLGWGLAGHLLLWGVLPSALLWWPRLKSVPWVQALAVRTLWVLVAVALAAASLLAVFADVASLVRNHKEVRYLLTPGNIIAAAVANTWGRAHRAPGPKLVVGADATLAASWSERRPTLFVLVVGETARARNFSLNGYGRATNPQLAQHDVISFPRATACGTSTEVSLPCMFSPYGRQGYDEEKIVTHESLLHVLARAGLPVLWRDNQSGCKGVCDGLPSQQLDQGGPGALCAEGQCLDEVLLHGMDRMLREHQGNLFVVMHQLGSHGPAYYKRYPATFKQFAPACENEDLRHCSSAEILNAYDNSLLYTDHFLGRVIDFLDRAQATHDTAMLYVSDHGESLGEGGLYLHGMPYALAPEVQKHVPLVVWLSPAFRQAARVDAGCLRAHAGRPVSHDNLFHSLLGVLDVHTADYEPARDLFAPCRPGVSAGESRY